MEGNVRYQMNKDKTNLQILEIPEGEGKGEGEEKGKVGDNSRQFSHSLKGNTILLYKFR